MYIVSLTDADFVEHRHDVLYGRHRPCTRHRHRGIGVRWLHLATEVDNGPCSHRLGCHPGPTLQSHRMPMLANERSYAIPRRSRNHTLACGDNRFRDEGTGQLDVLNRRTSILACRLCKFIDGEVNRSRTTPPSRGSVDAGTDHRAMCMWVYVHILLPLPRANPRRQCCAPRLHGHSTSPARPGT
jgi:hypothetical protein